MSDTVTFKTRIGNFTCQRFHVMAVVGQRVHLSDDFFVDVAETHSAILKKLGWSGDE